MKVILEVVNGEQFEVDRHSAFLPRVGESIEFNGFVYKVRDIIHHFNITPNQVGHKIPTTIRISIPRERQVVEKHPEIASEVLNYLYGTLLAKRNDFTPEKVPKAFLVLISDRVNDGHTKEEMKAVAYLKFKEWQGTDKEEYIRADTLYRPTNFQRYLAEVQTKRPKWNVVSTKEQKAIIKELNSYGVRGECNEDTDRLAKELMATGYDKKHFLNLYLIDKI